MSPLIIKLDPLVSSQIAAGEVVERPASVVKELIENSIDAKAKRISIEILTGGLELIRVSDDGIGMAREDALSAIERFATSKISSVNDLENLQTLGFRGEALPSIASCSKFTMETKAQEAESGVSLYVEGGNVVRVTDKGLPAGTTITVRDLFFNTPARLKFMKSKSRERDAVIETVERLALAWPSIGFTLRSHGKVVFHTPGNGLENALTNIFGPETAHSLLEVSCEYEQGVRIQGYIGMPRIYRRTRDRQIFSVNRRPVRNSLLGWAIDSAYSGLLPPRTYPVVILEITIAPEQIDVNVHPAKTEIKFRNERQLRQVVADSARQALLGAGYLSGPHLKESRAPGPVSAPWYPWSSEKESCEQVVFPYPAQPGTRGTAKIPRWQKNGTNSSRVFREPVGVHPDSSGQSGANPQDSSNELPQGWEYLGTLENTYVLAKTEDSLLIIDQHALAESLAYLSLLNGESGRQELLIPEIMSLEPKEAALYEEYAGALEKVGFSTRAIGTRTVSVTQVPLILGKSLPPDSLREILLSFSGETEKDVSPERLLARVHLATAACHGSVRGNEALTREEAVALITDLYLNPSARICPHGRPTVYQMLYSEIQIFFGR
ncbi:MAG TPA: DNA mismatch repair endonuclease MutL [Firmicutes bacterium]|nr:DNA mismatch repair endonuclease MutL [Bacillota bacterium]